MLLRGEKGNKILIGEHVDLRKVEEANRGHLTKRKSESTEKRGLSRGSLSWRLHGVTLGNVQKTTLGKFLLSWGRYIPNWFRSLGNKRLWRWGSLYRISLGGEPYRSSMEAPTEALSPSRVVHTMVS